MKRMIGFLFLATFSSNLWACYLKLDTLQSVCSSNPNGNGKMVVCLSEQAGILNSIIGCENVNTPPSSTSCSVDNGTWVHNYMVCPSDSEPGKTITNYSTNLACFKTGSIVNVDSQVLSEKIPLLGIPFSMVYTSDKTRGYTGWYEARIPITSPSYSHHSTILSSTATISIAGRTITQGFGTTAGINYDFTWDGLDNASNVVNGSVSASVSVEENYNFATLSMETAIAADRIIYITLDEKRLVSNITFPVTTSIFMGTIFNQDRSFGGWDFSIHHRYDPVRKVLYLGDGTTLNTNADLRSTGESWVVSGDRSEVYVFDSNFFHIETKDSLTGATRFSFDYDTQDRLVKVTDSYANETTVQYTGTVVTSITSPYGQITQLTTDANGYVDSVISPASETYEMTYSATGLLQTFEKPNGVISTMTYDSSGKLLSDVSSAGPEVNLSKTYNANGYTVTSTSAEGIVSNHTIEGNGGSYKRIDSISGHPTWTSEESDLQVNNLNNNSFYTQQTRGNDPRFGSLFKMPTGVTGGNGSIGFSSSYSETPVLSDPTDPFSLTSLGQVYTLNGKNYSTSYTTSTKTLVKTSPVGVIQTSVLNTHGDVVSSQLASYTPVTYGYDSRGRVDQISQGVSRVNTLAYNSSNGLVASITNPLSQSTSFTYNTAGRIVSQTLPDTRVISFSYDSVGNLMSITPPGRSAHTMTSTGFDALESYLPPTIASPAPPATIYTYNNDKQITQIDRPDLQSIDFAYDSSSGQLLSMSSLGTVRYFNNNSYGQMYMANSEDSVDHTIDYSGSNIIGEGLYYTGLSATLSYVLDSNNMTTSEEVTSSPSAASTIAYTYNNDALMITAGTQQIARTSTTGFINQLTLTNMRQHYTYSSTYGEISNILSKYNNTTNTYQEGITRDNLGRVITKTEQYGAGASNVYAYTYDSAGRLTVVTLNGGAYRSYVYDSNSNRTSQTVSGVTTAATYDGQDRLLTFGTKTFTYDDNGDVKTMVNTSPAGTTTFTYNVFGDLKSVAMPGKTINYKVDAHGRRIARLQGTTMKNFFIWNSQNQLVAISNANGTLNSRFVYGSKSHVPDYVIKGSTKYAIVTNHLGSPVQVVNASNGTVSQQITYDEWGSILTDTSPGFTPFGFAGCLYDLDTKLCRFGVRDYDPSIGRWLSKDPIRFEGGDTNLYGYVLQDPINYIDPTGLFPLVIIPNKPVISPPSGQHQAPDPLEKLTKVFKTNTPTVTDEETELFLLIQSIKDPKNGRNHYNHSKGCPIL